MFRLLLDRVQNGVKVKMGPLSILNYETASDVNFIIVIKIQFYLQILKCDNNILVDENDLSICDVGFEGK